MKYYQLTKDLPTFKAGELFCIVPSGSLVNVPNNVVAYSVTTLEKFPNILEDWFEEVPAPERDSKTKHAFMEYISDHKDERFFQAVRNFANLYLDEHIKNIFAGGVLADFEDTFYWECDELHKLKEEECES